MNQWILKASTSIVTSVRTLISEVKKIILEDIEAGKKIDETLRNVYNQQIGFMTRGLAEQMRLCAIVMSQAFVNVAHSVTSPKSVSTGTKVASLQVCLKHERCL